MEGNFTTLLVDFAQMQMRAFASIVANKIALNDEGLRSKDTTKA